MTGLWLHSLFLFLIAFSAHAQTWPSRPITLVVGFAAGGNLDGVARIFDFGETRSAAPLVARLRERLPGQPLIVSTTTVTGRAVAETDLRADVATLLPVDALRIVDRVFRRIRPHALILVETELWPGILRAAAAIGAPVAMVSGRLSARALSRYRWAGPLFPAALAHVAAFGMQTASDAERIVADPLPLPPHIPESPVGRVHELDGRVLLLGVGHDADTTIHLAELVAGVPYRVPKHCTVLQGGVPVRVEYGENDHCCRRFTLVDDWLREAGRQREGRVGNAHARLARSRDVVGAVVARLADDPLLFLHAPEAGCDDCDEARASVP